MDEYTAHTKFEEAIHKKVPQLSFLIAFNEEVNYRYEKLEYMEKSGKDAKSSIQNKVYEDMVKWYNEGSPSRSCFVGSGFYNLVRLNTWSRLYVFSLRLMHDELKERKV